MEIIGRLTADAEINSTKKNKQVVNFTIAINERTKKEGKWETVTAFINCAYWINTKVADLLKKGSVVSLFGRLSSSAYIDSNGEAQSVLHFHSTNIQLVSKA